MSYASLGSVSSCHKPPICLTYNTRPVHVAFCASLQLFQLSREHASKGGLLCGTLVWMFATESYPDYDGYTLYPSGAPAAGEARQQSCQPVVEDRQSVQLLRELAAAVGGRPAPS
jgi:hypothetical protein